MPIEHVVVISGPGRKVAAAREARGLTQLQLAVAASLSLATISNLERGCRVSELTLERVAKALGLPVEDLQ